MYINKELEITVFSFDCKVDLRIVGSFETDNITDIGHMQIKEKKAQSNGKWNVFTFWECLFVFLLRDG